MDVFHVDFCEVNDVIYFPESRVCKGEVYTELIHPRINGSL